MKKVGVALAIITFIFVSIVIFLNRFFINNPPPKSFLILGLDPRNDLLEKTETTDTIIFSKLADNYKKIKLFSLPRDLWYYPDSQKINQIYPSSLNRPSSFDYIKQSFESITGQTIDRVVIITTDNLKEIVDILGGVDVNLDVELKDTKYPNQDYISNPDSKAPIYKTIYYPAGINHLTSNNITEFVRSRKSAETVAGGGTDLGRIARQQKLLDAMLNKALHTRNPKTILSLYRYFRTSIKNDISNTDILALSSQIIDKVPSLELEKISIPTGENPDTDIIYHPTKFINQQWVFITKTRDYQTLKNFIYNSLLY